MDELHLLSITFFLYLASCVLYAILFFREWRAITAPALWILVAGFAVHTVTLGVRWKTAGHAPFSNMYESLIFFSWSFTLAYLAVEGFLRIKKLGFFALVLNVAILIYTFSHDSTAKPLMPALQSNWLVFHVITCFLSYGAFAVAFLASIIYLTPIHRKALPRPVLDLLMYKSILFGFPLLVLGVASGAVWANEAWGTYWSWDPKETWSLITCFIYAMYLHLRLMKGWEGKKLAWVAFGGFMCVIFTYLGVSYVLSGLHSYA